jgi:hypothetical protein
MAKTATAEMIAAELTVAERVLLFCLVSALKRASCQLSGAR